MYLVTVVYFPPLPVRKYTSDLSPSFNTVYFSHFTASLAVIQSMPFLTKARRRAFNLMMKDAAQFEPCATL